MSALIGMMKKPGERFKIKQTRLQRKPEADIIAVEIIGASVEGALIIRIMIAVVADDQNKILEGAVAQRKMPVEFSSAAAVIVGDQLGEQAGVGAEQQIVMESQIDTVFRAAEVVIAGKGSRLMQMKEIISMQVETLVFQRGFFF